MQKTIRKIGDMRRAAPIISKIPGIFGAVAGSPDAEILEYNSREVFPAASLIKIPILIVFLQELESGNLKFSETIFLKKKDKVGGSGILFELHDEILLTLLDLATLMIVVSDNTATNLLIDRMGISAIQKKIIKYGLKHTILGRKLMVAPDAPPANFTTPYDMFLLFQELLSGKILSRKYMNLALDILSRQQYNEKIPLLLPQNLKVAHKTGEISGARHDCGVIIKGRRKLILCFLTKELKDELKTDRLLAELSLELYQKFLGKIRK